MDQNLFPVLLPYLELLALGSLFTFIGSLVIIPVYIARLPQDYFLKFQTQRAEFRITLHSLPFVVLKNLLGILLLAAGFAMLFLPGQGILTILVGLLFISLPGKQKLIISLVTNPSVQKSLNWIRKKFSRGPFIWPKI